MYKNNKLILKSQHRFRCEKHNQFTEEVNKIALSASDNKKNTMSLFNRNMHMEWARIWYAKKKKLNVTI